MALAVLSPWPTTPAALAAAVGRLREAIAGRADDSDDAAVVSVNCSFRRRQL